MRHAITAVDAGRCRDLDEVVGQRTGHDCSRSNTGLRIPLGHELAEDPGHRVAGYRQILRERPCGWQPLSRLQATPQDRGTEALVQLPLQRRPGAAIERDNDRNAARPFGH